MEERNLHYMAYWCFKELCLFICFRFFKTFDYLDRGKDELLIISFSSRIRRYRVTSSCLNFASECECNSVGTIIRIRCKFNFNTYIILYIILQLTLEFVFDEISVQFSTDSEKALNFCWQFSNFGREDTEIILLYRCHLYFIVFNCNYTASFCPLKQSLKRFMKENLKTKRKSQVLRNNRLEFYYLSIIV